MDQVAHARARLESRIQEDAHSTDLLLSIFCSSLFNYRYIFSLTNIFKQEKLVWLY